MMASSTKQETREEIENHSTYPNGVVVGVGGGGVWLRRHGARSIAVALQFCYGHHGIITGLISGLYVCLLLHTCVIALD
jgi:hypothetical protein